jgi:hypothetical protein
MGNKKAIRFDLIFLLITVLVSLLIISACKGEETATESPQTSTPITTTSSKISPTTPVTTSPTAPATTPPTAPATTPPTTPVTTPPTTPATTPPTTPTNIDPQMMSILDQSLLAHNNTSTYKYEANMTIAVDVTGGSLPGTFEMTTYYKGMYDQEGQMQLFIEMSIDIPNTEETQTILMEMYLLDDYLYVKMAIPPGEEEWIKIPAGMAQDDIMGNFDVVNDTLTVLESPRTVELTGYELYEGEECYMIHVIPDLWRMFNWVMGQDTPYATASNENMVDLPTWADILKSVMMYQPSFVTVDQDDLYDLEKLVEMFEELSYTLWISTNLKLLKKLNCDLTVDLHPEDFGAAEDEFDLMVMSINQNMNVFDYNIPFTIVLPPEAENAPDQFDTPDPDI